MATRGTKRKRSVKERTPDSGDNINGFIPDARKTAAKKRKTAGTKKPPLEKKAAPQTSDPRGARRATQNGPAKKPLETKMRFPMRSSVGKTSSVHSGYKELGSRGRFTVQPVEVESDMT